MQHIVPYSKPSQSVIFQVIPLQCFKQPNDLRSVSDIDLRNAYKENNTLSIGIYTEQSFSPNFEAFPLRHDIVGKIHIDWYKVQDSFLLPPNSGLVYSGCANADDMRHSLTILPRDIERRPEYNFHGRPLHEYPIPAIDTDITACLEMHNKTDAFVKVLCMRLIDSVTTTHPTFCRE